MYPFLFEVEWTAGILQADRRIRSVENFEGPYREWIPERPVLWRSSSTNRTGRAGLLQGTDVSGEFATSIVRVVFVRVSPANRLQTVESKKLGRSTIFVKENRPQGFARFCKLGCGSDRTRGHLSTFVRF